MNKKILIMSVFTLGVMTLPLISTAQAKKGGIPTEIYRDLFVIGTIIPDDSPTDVWVRGNIQSASYTAHCEAPSFIPGIAGTPWIGIFWDGVPFGGAQSLMGTATYDIEYKINTNTMRGEVHLKTTVELDGGTFEGDMFWIGKLSWRMDYPNTVRMVNTGMWHTGWQGTGAYEGWKIIQNMNANPSWADVMQGKTAGDSHLIKPVDE